MVNRQTSRRRWNIFARELEDILAIHGLKLEHLAERGSIHREKIRRLRLSLLQPKSFPVLSPNEIHMLSELLRLTQQEESHLQAAVLSTIVEKMLTERINPDAAFIAAEEILPIIGRALQRRGGSDVGNKRGDVDMLKDDDDDLLLESALDSIDNANMAFHLSHNIAAHNERVLYARQACDDFNAALGELVKVRGDIRELVAWSEWQAEAQAGLQDALQRLSDLGAL